MPVWRALSGWASQVWRAFSGGNFLGEINNNHNKSIFKVQSLVPRDYSKHIYTHTQTHRGTCTHKHSDCTGVEGTFWVKFTGAESIFWVKFTGVEGTFWVKLIIIIIKLFLKLKILSLETILSAYTYTNTQRHLHTSILTVQVWRALSEWNSQVWRAFSGWNSQTEHWLIPV